MEEFDRFDDETASGLTDAEIRWVARRQLVGSLVVVAMIAAAASVIMVTPTPRETVEIAPHKIAMIQKPSFATPPGQRVAAVARGDIELP